MTLPPQRWLKAVLLATTLVFVGVAVYLFAFRLSAWGDSDAAVPVLLAAKALHATSPVVGDWYYANRDVWVFGPQLIALLPVAILGVGPASLLVSLVLGFALQFLVFVKSYVRLGGELWVALFAAMATLMAWSNAHAAYVYVQIAYGFVTCLYVLSFTLFATVAESTALRAGRIVVGGLLVAVIAVQNPTRALVFVVAPVMAVCVWPWQGFPVRRRLAIAAAAIAGWVLAFAVYKWLIVPAVTFSIPRGHVSFFIGGLARIKQNLAMLVRGLELLCAGHGSGVRAIPGALLLVGAIALVSREVFTSRALTALRFVCVIVLAQFGVVLVLLVVGNLLTDKESARYLMPSLLAMVGLAVVIAVRAVGEVGKTWWRRLAFGWLVAVPVAALAAAPDASPPAQRKYVRPDAPELALVADALVERGLTHGFAINIAANWLTLQSGGTALTCPVHFRHVLLAHRWLADTACFVASNIPDRFFVVVDQADHEREALRFTLPPELERFTVGDTYEVFVYRTAGASLAWLDLPIPDGELASLPLRLPATHLQLVRGEAVVESGQLVATGKPGTVVYGPYLELPKGNYIATWTGQGLGSGGQLSFAVTVGGRKTLAPTVLEANQLPSARAELVRIPFTLGPKRSGIEFPIQSQNGGRVSLHELVIEKQPPP